MTKPNIPAAPLWLTLSGVIPFIGLAGLMTANPADGDLKIHVGVILMTYAALILSFLGGVRWGAEMTHAAPASPNSGALIASVVGTLVAWAIIILVLLRSPEKVHFVALAGMLVWQGLWDMRGGAALPAWYPRLRLIATLGAAASLLLAALVF